MKRFIAVLALAFGLVVGIGAPAQAYIDDPMINGRKFASTSVCVGSTLLQSYYRVPYIAQTINNSTQTLALDFSTDCAAEGYPASRRLWVGTFQNADHPYCLLFTNQENASYNGFQRWTNAPRMYLNTGLSTCISTQTRRDHWLSQAIVWHLGLTTLDSTGMNSHVMNQTDWSRDNVGVLHSTEGVKLDQVYMGNFCDSGHVC